MGKKIEDKKKDTFEEAVAVMFEDASELSTLFGVEVSIVIFNRDGSMVRTWQSPEPAMGTLLEGILADEKEWSSEEEDDDGEEEPLSLMDAILEFCRDLEELELEELRWLSSFLDEHLRMLDEKEEEEVEARSDVGLGYGSPPPPSVNRSGGSGRNEVECVTNYSQHEVVDVDDQEIGEGA